MIIRIEAPHDRPAIRRTVTAAFGQEAEADLVDALRASGDAAISLVAEDGGNIVGHILFSKLQAPERCLALAPVSVAPSRQSRGIGSKLISEGLARAKSAGWRGVFLLGAPDYYRRFGFSPELAESFESPYPKPYFMALELAPGALSGMGGEVIYAAPFQKLG